MSPGHRKSAAIGACRLLRPPRPPGLLQRGAMACGEAVSSMGMTPW